ncbi:MAG: ADP-ribosylglycohydrolase family protein, partial [Proteobacteria bacterium]|nr:ADP-ribosylglycohydrolase family protein [Pseudomonadota bacterium]
AQAVAAAVYLARTSGSKERIQDFIRQEFGYLLNRRLDEIRPHYCFDVSCQGSVPEAITAFLESDDVEDAIRNAISLGGDSDTMACIAGAIAEAYYREIPEPIKNAVYQYLPAALAQTTLNFRKKFIDE